MPDPRPGILDKLAQQPGFRAGRPRSESLELHSAAALVARGDRSMPGLGQRGLPHAGALSGNPDLLIADEPTTTLDVTIQAQILELLKRLKADFGSAVALITCGPASMLPATLKSSNNRWPHQSMQPVPV